MIPNRAQLRQMARGERKAMRSGQWPEWEFTPLPNGPPGAAIGGWTKDVRGAWSNRVFAVLVRPVTTPWGLVHHLAIRTVSGLDPPWRDLQRIKNEILGEDRLALQVYPPEARLIDAANMYHLWVMPIDWRPHFGLHHEDENRTARESRW